MDKYSDMTDEQLRLTVAEHNGWKLYREENGDMRVTTYECDKERLPIMDWFKSKPFQIFYDARTGQIPYYSTDIDAAFRLESQFVGNGDAQVVYSRCLAKQLDTYYPQSHTELFAFVHATPRQRCIAWLECVNGGWINL